MLKNFAQEFASSVTVVPEVSVHPHAEAERAHEFRSFGAGGAELEVLNFLNALVFMFKPVNALETGTGSGYTSAAIASGLMANGRGQLTTIEADPSVLDRAKDAVAKLDASLLPQISFTLGRSLEWIGSYEGPAFDFVFFDSLLEFRHKEFSSLQNKGALASQAVCVFHDTSRLRGEYYADYNPAMIEALDQASFGKQWLELPLSRGLRLLKLD